MPFVVCMRQFKLSGVVELSVTPHWKLYNTGWKIPQAKKVVHFDYKCGIIMLMKRCRS